MVTWTIAATRVVPVPYALPFGRVGLNPFAKLAILLAVAWHHRDEATTGTINVLHVLARAQLGVGDVQEVRPARQQVRSVSQVWIWVRESVTLPSLQRKATGT